MKIKLKVIISGKVQGVFFRVNTKNKAEQFGVNGWVKNTSDGKVEAVFEGDENKIYEMIEWCSKGPSNSKVTKIDIIKKKYKNEYDNFSIIY
jgi:acylphosphatase